MFHAGDVQCPSDGDGWNGNGGGGVGKITTMTADVEPPMLRLALKSVQTYRSRDEYLCAMKEDLAECFNALYGLRVTEEDFFDHLATGVLLCRHATALQVLIRDTSNSVGGGHDDDDERIKKGHRKSTPKVDRPSAAVGTYHEKAQPETFQARDNIAVFLRWCRSALRLSDTLLFETEDLVARKNERNVVLCLLEVARRGAKFGMLAPTLVQFEEEIDAELAAAGSSSSAAQSEADPEEDYEMDDGDDSWSQSSGGSSVSHRRRRSLRQRQADFGDRQKTRPRRPVVQVDMMSLDEMVSLDNFY